MKSLHWIAVYWQRILNASSRQTTDCGTHRNDEHRLGVMAASSISYSNWPDAAKHD